MAEEANDADFAGLIRSLSAGQQSARRLGLVLAADLIAAATMEVALEWTHGRNSLADPQMRLEQLLRLRIVHAWGEGDGNVLPILSGKRGT